MSPYVRKLTKNTGVNSKKAESAWSEAIIIAEEMFGKKMDKFGKDEFDYAYQTALEAIRKQEIRYSLANFVESGMSAKDYIEMVVSGDFSLDHSMQNKDMEDDEDYEMPFEVVREEGDSEEDEDDNEEEPNMDDLNERVKKLIQKEYAETQPSTEKVYEEEDFSAFDEIPLNDAD